MTSNSKILLVGDSCIDEYHYGTCDRLSPEAPVPVLKINRSESRPGMAANVYANLEAFGCDVDFMTHGAKSVKKRYIDERSKQHIVRVDEDHRGIPFNPHTPNITYAQYDAVVFSDYDKGYVSYDSVEEVRKLFSGPIFVDSKKRDLARFDGCLVKVNQLEGSLLISKPSDLIVTLGSAGAEHRGVNYPAEQVEVVDVCGAGDTFLAALAYWYLSTKDLTTAIKFANLASAMAVQHTGVYVPSSADIDQIKFKLGQL